MSSNPKNLGAMIQDRILGLLAALALVALLLAPGMLVGFFLVFFICGL